MEILEDAGDLATLTPQDRGPGARQGEEGVGGALACHNFFRWENNLAVSLMLCLDIYIGIMSLLRDLNVQIFTVDINS